METHMEDSGQLLARLLRQEERLQFTEFTNDIAFEIGLKLVETAQENNLSLTVDIRRTGQQLFHYALPGTTRDNDEWIKRKNRVVNRFGHSSFYIGRLYASQGTTIEEKALLDPTKYAPHGGAFPIIVRGIGVIGTITVSGLPQREDHELVVRVLSEYLGVTDDQ